VQGGYSTFVYTPVLLGGAEALAGSESAAGR